MIVRWSERLWAWPSAHGVGGGANGSGCIAGHSAAECEARSLRQGSPRVLALIHYLVAVYEDFHVALVRRECSNLESLCAFLLRPFAWLEGAVRRAALEHRVDELSVHLRRIDELEAVAMSEAEPEPEPEATLQPESELELEEMLGIIDSDLAALGGGGGDSAKGNAFFLSHYQANGGDQARILHFRLDPHGGCWYDQTAAARGDAITRRGMVRGVLESRCFVLLLTKGVFSRWFCRLEIRTAMRLNTPILMVYESDDRHADAYCGPPGCEVSSYAAEAPPDMKQLFEGVEAVPFHRQELEQQAMIKRLLLQAGVPDPRSPRAAIDKDEVPACEAIRLVFLPSCSTQGGRAIGDSMLREGERLRQLARQHGDALALDPRPCSSDAALWQELDHLAEEARHGVRCDVLHMCGHGEHDGLVYDVSPLKPDILAKRIVEVSPRCVILQACRSAQFAVAIRELDPSIIVVSWSTDVRTRVCEIFTERFYTSLCSFKARPKASALADAFSSASDFLCAKREYMVECNASTRTLSLKSSSDGPRPTALPRRSSAQASRHACSLYAMVLKPQGVDEADFVEHMRQRTEAVVAEEQNAHEGADSGSDEDV